MTTAVDLFAGPGGWDLAARALGVDPLGIELDAAVCATRDAANLRTLQADVADLAPGPRPGPDLLIGSPPCPSFSSAGLGAGRGDLPFLLGDGIRHVTGGGGTRALADECDDPRSALILEPLRWALALEPRLIVLEQVPPCLPAWEAIAQRLRFAGWWTWTGMLSAERYGVPQTRERAFLIADRARQPEPPAPTHRRYVAPLPDRGEPTLFDPGERRPIVHPDDRDLLPWISMAQALGWRGSVGFPRRDDLGGDGYRERDWRDAAEPAFVVGEKARSWTRIRPATTVAGDHRVHPPGHKENGDDEPGRYEQRRGANAVRVTVEEAAALQTFPRGYPWQGTRTAQFHQVGNAVPPRLARRVLEAALEA